MSKYWLLQAQSAGAPWAACRLDGWTLEPGLAPHETPPDARVGFIGRLLGPVGTLYQQAQMRPPSSEWVPAQVDAPVVPGAAEEGELARATHAAVGMTGDALRSRTAALARTPALLPDSSARDALASVVHVQEEGHVAIARIARGQVGEIERLEAAARASFRGTELTPPIGARVPFKPMGDSVAPIMFVPGPTLARAMEQLDELLPPPAWMRGDAP